MFSLNRRALAPLAWLRALRRAGAVAPAGPLRGPVPLISNTLEPPGTRDPEAFLFPSYAHEKGCYPLRHCWRAVCAEAKLGNLRLRGLRHTIASLAVMSDENLPLVGRLLGHRQHRTMAGYAHLADGHLVEMAEKVGCLIAGAMALDKVSRWGLYP